MRIRVEQRVLRAALQSVQGIVDKKSTLNVLAFVLVETIGRDAFMISATDYDVGLRAVHRCEVEDPGSACLNGMGAFAAVKALPDGPLVVASQPNDWIHVTAGRSVVKLPGIPKDDFPALPNEQPTGVAVPKADLTRVLDYCAPVMSRDESRMNLNGVFLELQDLELRGTATDSHRLVTIAHRIRPANPPEKPIRVIAHRHGIEELRRLLASGEDESVSLGTCQNNLVVSYGSAVLSVRLIEDQFPEYQRVIPHEWPSTFVAMKADVLAALRIASVVASSAKATRVYFEPTEGRVRFRCNDADRGESEAECHGEATGEAIVLGLNASYLREAIEAAAGDTVRFGFIDRMMPIDVRGTTDENARTVIMVMDPEKLG